MSHSKTVQQINDILNQLSNTTVDFEQQIFKQAHTQYTYFILTQLKQAIIHFDVAQPWLYYYCVNTLNILGSQISEQMKQKIVKAVNFCENQGYGGGYKQVPHLAPTYASFLTLLSLGPKYLENIDKSKLTSFFKKVKKGGRFMMHQLGECDIRGSYIVAIIVKFLGLDEDILQGVAQHILASQTTQGGISNIIGGQAHGGFTFCGVAALAIMNRLHELDISRLMVWTSHRQVQFGGFNGRTNKLIDSCYSFWIGGIFNIVNNYFENKVSIQNHLIYCQQNLQKYILLYCQQKRGGLFDKPGKSRDCYHTCYALSGLSLSQQFEIIVNDSKVKKLDPIYNVQKQIFQQCKKQYCKHNKKVQ